MRRRTRSERPHRRRPPAPSREDPRASATTSPTSSRRSPSSGRDRDRIIKVPIRGIREYRFVYGDNHAGRRPGQRPARARPGGRQGASSGRQGARTKPATAGVDYYETEVTLEELIEIMFEDLELPDLERKTCADRWPTAIAQAQGLPAGRHPRPARPAPHRASAQAPAARSRQRRAGRIRRRGARKSGRALPVPRARS